MVDITKIAAIYADAEHYSGMTVTVGGWAKTIRDLKTFGFIELNDGSCFRNLQVVMDANILANYKEIAAQNVGAALIVIGEVVLTPEAKQPLELKATEIAVEGPSTPDYPLQKKRHSVEFLRTIQHLRPRTNLFNATFRVRSAAAFAVHEFFQSRGFTYVNTPIITGSDCEGAGEMFQVTTLDLENVPKTEDGKVDWGTDLQTEHERFLTEQIFKRPVFVTDYPKEIKAFYMRLNDDGKTVAAADCLVPGIGEIIGGSQREERLDVLESRIKELGMNPADYWWYCDLRRYGSCRHAGFGLGFERMVMYLTGVGNIRDVELHPRTVGNAEF